MNLFTNFYNGFARRKSGKKGDMHMYRLGLWVFAIGAFTALIGCSSVGSTKSNVVQPRPQVLSDDDKARLDSYKKLDRGILVEEIQTSPSEGESFKIDPFTEAYEGMLVASLLGLGDQLTVKEEYLFVKALFEKIPQQSLASGAPIRNIVVAKWYKKGEPLIVHVSKAFNGNKIPSVVALFNTASGIRDLGENFIRSLGPSKEYPRFTSINGRTVMQAEDYYSISILPNGMVSASSAVGKTLPGFDEISNAKDRVNLTDDYLRDGNRENDALVLPVLKAVISDEKTRPIIRLHANLQLFVYHLFAGDLDSAKNLSDDLLKSSLLSDQKVAKTEIAEVARKELPKILAIAKALATGDESGL